MSRDLVEIMHGKFNYSHEFWVQFIDVCPDTLWEKRAGGFLVWQHLYHCLCGYAFFATTDPSEAPVGLFDSSEAQDIFHFKKEPKAPSKKAVADYAEKVKALVDSCFKSITDADLIKKNEVMSKVFGKELTHLDIFTMLSTHNMYHFGACDGALRDNGLPGLF